MAWCHQAHLLPHLVVDVDLVKAVTGVTAVAAVTADQ
jgi:hypothetical protein